MKNQTNFRAGLRPMAVAVALALGAAVVLPAQAFEFGNFSIGSSIGIMLFLLNIVGAVVYVRTQRSSHV